MAQLSVQTRLFELVNSVESDTNFRAIDDLRQALREHLDISKIVDPVTGNTLLHQATVQNKAQVVRIILSHPSVDEYFVQKHDKNRDSALDICKKNGNLKIRNSLHTSILRDRGKQFIGKLLQRYKTEIEKNRRRAEGENVPDSPRSNFSRVKRLVEVVSKPFGVGGIASCVTSTADEARQMYSQRQAEKVWRAHGNFYRHHNSSDLPTKLMQHLIRDGVEIFSCFEQQMLKHSFKEWEKICDKLVSDCVKRMIIHIGAQYNDNENSLNLDEDGSFSKCFALASQWKWKGRKTHAWKMVEMAGLIITLSDGAYKCYDKVDGSSKVEKYGFRKAFEFEKAEEFLKVYASVPVPAINPFLLTEKRVQKLRKKLLVERNILIEESIEHDEDDAFGINIPSPVIAKPFFQFGVVAPVDSFVGRREELDTLLEYWNSGTVFDDAVGWLLVTQSQFNQAGCCGIGKAELVRNFAHKLNSDSESPEQQPNVVFIDARNLDEQFGQLYEQILEFSGNGVPLEQIPVQYLPTLCYRSLNRHKRTLFVLLNVGCFEQIQEYLPSKSLSNIQVVITTRTPSSEWGNFDGRRLGKIELKALSEEECEKLMQSIGTHKNLDIKRLGKVLDYSPLALQQIKKYVLQKQESQPDEPKGKIAAKVVSGYIEALFWNKSEFTEDAVAIYKMDVNGKNLFKLWNEVFDFIGTNGEVGKIALEIVEFMAYMLTLPVFVKTFMKSRYPDERLLNQAIKLLLSYNILIDGGSNGMYAVSKLIKKCVRFQNNVELQVEQEKLGNVLQHWQNLITGNHAVQLSGDYIRHIVFAWSYAKHYDNLVDLYILKQDYSEPSNYFLHILLKHDEYQALEYLLPQIHAKLKNDKKKLLRIGKSKFLADGKTILHLAAARQEASVRKMAFRMFLTWGGKDAVKAIDWEGNTPYHEAAQCGHTDVIKMMLEIDKSAIHLRNDKGESAFDLAKKADAAESMWLMLRYSYTKTDKLEKKEFDTENF